MIINKVLLKLKETDAIIFDLESKEAFKESLSIFYSDTQQFKVNSNKLTHSDFDFNESEISIHAYLGVSMIEIGLWYGITIDQMFIQCNNDNVFNDLYDMIPIIKMSYQVEDFDKSKAYKISDMYKGSIGRRFAEGFTCINIEQKNGTTLSIIMHEDNEIYTLILYNN